MQHFFGTSEHITHHLVVTDLEPGLVPDRAVIEGPGGGEEEHHGDQGVEDHREDQRDQVEERDVREEHRDVHRRVAAQTKVTFWNLNIHFTRLLLMLC